MHRLLDFYVFLHEVKKFVFFSVRKLQFLFSVFLCTSNIIFWTISEIVPTSYREVRSQVDKIETWVENSLKPIFCEETFSTILKEEVITIRQIYTHGGV